MPEAPAGINCRYFGAFRYQLLVALPNSAATLSILMSEDKGIVQWDMSKVRRLKQPAGGLMPVFPGPTGAETKPLIQTVMERQRNQLPDQLIVTANPERKLRILDIPHPSGTEWKLAAEIQLPAWNIGTGTQLVRSARIGVDKELVTIEGSEEDAEWGECHYALSDDNDIAPIKRVSIPSGRFGLDFHPRNLSFLTVTDETSREPHGIYNGGRLILPGYCGRGLASTKTHIVLSQPAKPDQSGGLVFIPIKLLKL